ncbi:MAG: hypothetical protein KDA84_17120, partial [Planctomycetaceae bacterium]|nr:hypothetical protein [Planctomycetaceae bacterium]
RQMDVTLQTSVVHGVMWVLVGLGVGIACGLLAAPRLKSIGKATITLVGTGIVVGLFYPFLAAVFFPNDRSDWTVPDGFGNRIFWAMLASLLFSIAVGRTLNTREQSVDGPTTV